MELSILLDDDMPGLRVATRSQNWIGMKRGAFRPSSSPSSSSVLLASCRPPKLARRTVDLAFLLASALVFVSVFVCVRVRVCVCTCMCGRLPPIYFSFSSPSPRLSLPLSPEVHQASAVAEDQGTSTPHRHGHQAAGLRR